MQRKPTIGLTMGDPAGVGPEIVLSVVSRPEVHAFCRPVVFGDLAVLQRCSAHLGQPPLEWVIVTPRDLPTAQDGPEPLIVDLQAIAGDAVQIARVSGESGYASYRYIQAAIDAALERSIDAVTTAPINKEALRAAGIN